MTTTAVQTVVPLPTILGVEGGGAFTEDTCAPAGSTPDLSTDHVVTFPVLGRVVRRLKQENLTLEVLCGVTVALALVPEALAFSLAAGLKPSVGLHSAWIVSIGAAILGGRPAMVSGATGSLAVLVGDLVAQKGVEYLFVAVVVMGALEILLGLIGVGSLVILIPAPVMIGFCNGLALVLFLAQFGNFKDPARRCASESVRRLGSFDAFAGCDPFLQGGQAVWAVVITATAFLVCMFLPKLTKKVPSALVAIAAGTVVEWALARAIFHTGTPLVSDIAALEGSLPQFAWASAEYTMPPLNLETLWQVLPVSVTMATVGLLESLMTLNLVDEMTGTRGNTRRECIGQGIANLVCGLFSGMGGCAMVGQSMINVNSGATSRVSSASAGLALLLVVLVAYPAINVIPVSALVGVMFDVVVNTFEWSSLKLMLIAAMPLRVRERLLARKDRSKQKIRRFDALVILVVTLVTLFTDLAVGVAAGMLVAAFTFIYDTATRISVNTREESDPNTGTVVKYYDVHGMLFFGSCTHFLSLFDEQNDPDDVRLVFEAGYIADYSAIQALNKLGERYGKLDKTVTLQQLKPSCSKIVSKSAGLLVKELAVSLESEEVLNTTREHLNVEHRGLHHRAVDRELTRDSRRSSTWPFHVDAA